MAQEAQRSRVIGGRYRLVTPLHTGGFGRVWQAHDQRLREDVAVKEVWLPPDLSAADRRDRLVRAEREARNAAQLRNHPNVVAVRDVVTEDGVPWIVMRLVTGHSLAEDLTAIGPLSPGQVMYVADGLLKALGAAHAAGIVHRDVKPANVMFSDTGEVLLTDFGIAVHETDSTLTASGMLVGSTDYIAPERIRGDDGKAAGDMFSLGVTLYQAVTGVAPFHRDTMAASLAAILFEEPKPPRCPAGLSALIMRLLAKDPQQRPTVPVARGLLAALSANGERAPKPTKVAPAPKVAATPKRPTKVAGTPKRPTKVAATPKRPTKVAVAPAPRPPTRVATPPARFQPPRRMRRAAAKAAAQRARQVTPQQYARQAARRRPRRGPSLSVIVLVALGIVGVHAAWGRDATGASVGDCVYGTQQSLHLEPCALPVPWRTTANYKVLQRIEGPSGQCEGVPGWEDGDNATVLQGMPPVTLCLAPVH